MTYPPPTPTTDRTVESKLTVASLITFAFSVAAAILNAVQERPDLLGDLPPVLQFIIIAALPPVLAFAAGWAKTSNRAP